ncbi:RNaseH [Serratia phage SP1]|nr:RNaseH [Serratia phage SP1]
MNLNDFMDPEDQVKEGYLLFDMSQIALAAALQNFEDKEPVSTTMVRHIVLNSIKYNLKKFRAKYPNVILAFDNHEGGYWRRKYGWYYKKTRAEGREESQWDWEGYFTAMNKLVEEFPRFMPYYSLSIPGVEADDTIGVLTERLALQGHPIMIVSSDGDYTQLHKFKEVKQWSPMHKKLVHVKNGSARMDLFHKLLKGDRKDSVASVRVRNDFWARRIDGERTPAMKAKVIEDCAAADGYDQIESILKEAYPKDLNLIERFKENEIMIDMSKMPTDIKQSILDKFEQYNLAPRSRIYSYFVKCGLAKLMNNINEF